MTPIVDGLEREFEGEVAVVRLDAAVADHEQLQMSYGLRGHPSFAVLDGYGRVTAIFFGPQPVETLREGMTAVRPPSS